MNNPFQNFSLDTSPKQYMTPGVRMFPTRHPNVANDDGSYSNVKIFGYSESDDGPIYALPSMVDGAQLSEEEAIKVALQNGLQNYPQHPNSDAHNAWAGLMHDKIGEDGVLMDKPVDREAFKLFGQ